MQEWQASGLSVWVGPEIEADDEEGRMLLSQYLMKCTVKLSRLRIERRDGADVVCYTSDKGVRDLSPLDFLAELSAHIPGTFEKTIRFYGEYSPRFLLRRNLELAANAALLCSRRERLATSSRFQQSNPREKLLGPGQA